jgi:hypothetical protein
MRDALSGIRCTKLLVAALCVSGALWGVESQARDDDDKRRYSHFERRHRDSDFRHDSHRRHSHRYSHFDRRDFRHRDWHYHRGRYWAPAHYRGRYCDDRRHFRGVHYHVAARDYYDYYYPRYRYYGPKPYGANASVIISVPLF